MSGPGLHSLRAEIEREVIANRPSAVGIAVAYVSVYGARFLEDLQDRAGIGRIALVADVRDAITHPEALRLALRARWRVRVVDAATTFHPKLIVAGRTFDALGKLVDPRLSFVGSANLTKGGLDANSECSFVNLSDAGLPAAGKAFYALWERGKQVDAAALDAYERVFAARNRQRSALDLKALGVADDIVSGATALRGRAPPNQRERSISTAAAAAAWTGLESFTGDYRLQIEFPRDAGEVLGRIISATGSGPDVDVLCEDGVVRTMRYRFYENNSMFRLNVPNETPGAEWARDNHAGIAYVGQPADEGQPLIFRIIRPGREATELIGRSVALGTWGKTTTRLYGWF